MKDLAVSVLLLVLAAVELCSAQNSNSGQIVNIRLCTGGFNNFHLCNKLKSELLSDSTLVKGTIPFFITLPGASQSKFAGDLQCIPANNSLECAEIVLQNKADLARFSAEELYGLSKIPQYATLAPIAAGQTRLDCPSSTECHEFSREFSVAVVKKSSGIKQMSDLRDRNACFGRVGSTVGWTVPVFKSRANWVTPRPIITRFKRQRGIYTNVTKYSDKDQDSEQIVRCPMDLSVANDVYPKSCAPGQWATQKSFADLFSQRLCAGCMGTNVSCTDKIDRNHAMECLKFGRGDVAFVSSLELRDYFPPDSPHSQDYALLCDIGLRDVSEYHYCHWGVVPADAYVLYNGRGRQYVQQVYGEFIHQLFAKASNDYYAMDVKQFLAGKGDTVAKMVRLDRHYGRNSKDPVAIPSAKTYLQREGGKEFYAAMQGSFPTCQNKDKMRMCVISSMELEKCQQIQMAFKAAAMPDSLVCILGYSETDCIRKINSSIADIAMISAHRADEATHLQKIKPLLGESYGKFEPVYVVAVALTTSRAQKLKDLNSGQLNVCSSGTDTFAGWEAPNRVFKDLSMIAQSNCQLTEAWAKIFRGGCVPGAKNATVTLGRNQTKPIDQKSANHLCSKCGTGSGACKTPTEATGSARNYDKYYGDIGALRCLVRRDGDVALLRSTALQTMLTLKEMGDVDFRTMFPTNFVLLCSDGNTNKPFSQSNIATCNLGRMPDRWMVARMNVDGQQLLRWQDLWELGYNRARNSYDWLRTFVRKSEHILDLIFTNTTEKLERFPVISEPDSYYYGIAYKNWKSPFQCSGSKSFYCHIILTVVTFLLLIQNLYLQ